MPSLVNARHYLHIHLAISVEGTISEGGDTLSLSEIQRQISCAHLRFYLFMHLVDLWNHRLEDHLVTNCLVFL